MLLIVLREDLDMYSLLKKASTFGLSIQAESIQLVEFKANKPSLLLSTQHILKTTDFGLSEANLFVNKHLTLAIQTILARAKPRARQVTLHIPHYFLKEDSITIPLNLKHKEIEREIAARIETTYPAMKAAMHVAYVQERDTRKRQTHIHFILAKRAYIEALMHAVQQAGLIINTIDTEQHALLRTWHYLLSINKINKEWHGLLSITLKRALLLLIKDGKIIFTEETEWQEDSKQLNQFLTFIATTRLQSPLHLLLTGCAQAIQQLLSQPNAFPCAIFHTVSLFTEEQSASLSEIEQSELFIAFGLAIRKLFHA